MGHRKAATTMADIVGKPEKIVFTKEHMQEFANGLKKKYGVFDKRAFNRFVSTNKIARIAWSVTYPDGSKHGFESGRLMGVTRIEGANGSLIWKDYKLQGDVPYLFWEDLYNQTVNFLGKQEYGSQKQLQDYAKMEQSLGTQMKLYDENE